MAQVLEDEARAYLLRTGYWRSVERLECGLAVEGDDAAVALVTVLVNRGALAFGGD